MTRQNKPPRWKKPVAIFAAIFGAISLFKAGGVLFGPQSAVDAAGRFVPFVVWFNFIAGGFYILAGVGIYLGRPWARWIAGGIALGTILVATAFVRHLVVGGAFEMQTVGALAIRAGFWCVVTLLLWRGGRKL